MHYILVRVISATRFENNSMRILAKFKKRDGNWTDHFLQLDQLCNDRT